ncbi:MAG TPA: amidohydrolase, partial [Bacteroidia bacterium]|nr:amidohydrolase [Bacteroidia bacterium]
MDSALTDQNIFQLYCNSLTSTKVQGGEIITKNNHLTGLLIDNAVDIVKAHIPEFTAQIKTEGLIKGEQNCFAVGLTSVTDAGLRVS